MKKIILFISTGLLFFNTGLANSHKNTGEEIIINEPQNEAILSKITPAESYSFDHKIEMQITAGKELVQFEYYLPNSGNFLCASVQIKEMKNNFYTVFDLDREAFFTYMEEGGQKISMGMSIKTANADSEENEAPISFAATGNSKSILGYKCMEYKISGKDVTGNIWLTKDVDIRFPSNFYNIEQDNQSNQKWMKDLDGWAMEMEMIDKSKGKQQTIKMICTSIDKSNLTINSNDYFSIQY